MIYCPNPDCLERENIVERMTCQTCQTTLVIKGRYRLIEPLRKISLSGCAEVFTVQDLFSTTKVMKILRVGDPKLLELFDRESRVLQELDHPGIPKIEASGYFSVQTATGLELKCLVMEKILGIDLEQWLKKNHCCLPDLALHWLKQIVDILEHLHQHQFFHRDIKPGNIMIKPDNQLALIDFGAARQITATVWGNANLTTVLTPGYAPPEQLNCQAVPQSDFYALGRTFVHLLTGEHPLNSDIDIQGNLKWRSHLPKGFPRELADLVDHLMAPLVTNRPKNTTIIQKRLHRIEQIQSSYFWRIITVPNKLQIIKIINTLPLVALGILGLSWFAWWCAISYSWNSIKPLSSIEISRMKMSSKQCFGLPSVISDGESYPWAMNRSAENFSLNDIKVGEQFYVQITKDTKSKIQFDIKEENTGIRPQFDYFDRTMIKNMKAGFYKRVNNYPLNTIYIANPKNTGKSKFTIKFCRLK